MASAIRESYLSHAERHLSLRSGATVDPAGFASVSELLETGAREGVFPGAVLVVSRRGELLYRRAVGTRWARALNGADLTPMSTETVFDVAGVTSTVVTTTLLMRLLVEGKLKLTDRLARYVHGFGVLNKSTVTIGQILSHTSGLPAWIPFFEELLRANSGTRMGILTSRLARDFVVNAINRGELKYESGAKQLYSDLGLIMQGYLAEILTGLTLEKAAQRFIFGPLGLKSTSFIDLSLIKRRGIHPVTDLIAPTEECPWRKRVLCGEVHDDNAWAMGGVAGHAGLFMTANDLHVFAREMLLSSQGKSEFLPRTIVEEFWRGPEEGVEGSWRYGWDTPSAENGLAESGLSPRSVGHCGFTGCSLWIEPEEGICVVLMSNRVHPTRSNRKIRAFRPALHGAVLKAAVLKAAV